MAPYGAAFCYFKRQYIPPLELKDYSLFCHDKQQKLLAVPVIYNLSRGHYRVRKLNAVRGEIPEIGISGYVFLNFLETILDFS